MSLDHRKIIVNGKAQRKPKSYSILYIYTIINKEFLFSPKNLIPKIRDYVIIGLKSTTYEYEKYVLQFLNTFI